MISATGAWQSQLSHVLDVGTLARDTREIIASQVRWDMNRPLVVNPNRKVNYKFAAAEAAYIISGQNQVEFLVQNAMKSFVNYSDDGIFQSGAYGPPFVDQLPYVINCLREDRSSRQAVISIWRPRPYKSKDIPCTLTLQFLIRDDTLSTVINMRSSDIWKGLIYDMFCFSIMSAVVAYYVDVSKLGLGYIHAGSSHLYTRDEAAAESLVKSDETSQYMPGPTISIVDINSMFHWLLGCCDLGDREDCLIGLYGGKE